MSRVFFSYASEERSRVMEFVPAFESAGIAVSIDHEQIRFGGPIAGKIDDMIAESNGAIIFYSGYYAEKPWTKEEQNALVFRSITRDDYQIVVVRLDQTEPPPLLAHRLWAREPDARALATVFATNLRQAMGSHGRMATEVKDWLQTFSEDELHRLGLAINLELRQRPSALTLPFRSRKAGDVLIYLWQPLVHKFADNLSFLINVQDKISFIRNDLRRRLAVGGLGPDAAAFMLAEQEKVGQIEDFRKELRETLDVLVEKISFI